MTAAPHAIPRGLCASVDERDLAMDACYLEELTTLPPRACRVTLPMLSGRSMGRMPPMSEMKVVLLLTFRNKNKEPPSVDLSRSKSQRQEASYGTYSDDETIGSLLRGKKNRLSTSDITENKPEHLDSPKNIALGVGTIGSNVM
ncbi:electron transporter [Hordeum vulgare]|nr:electron transporter [Hordeum vulgare]